MATLCHLLACLPEDPVAFSLAAAAVEDWSALLRLAEQHGVLGVLNEDLVPLDMLPSDTRMYLRQRRDLERLWDAHLRDTLGPILRAMSDAGLPTIALKGPLLAERLYDDPSTRRSSDLDLLVAPGDLPEALRVLERFDYRTEQGASAGYHRQFRHHWELSCPHRPLLELHFRLYVGFGAHVEAGDFFERARAYETQGRVRCFILDREDEFLYLCLHAAGHDFSRLGWLYDLKLYLQREPLLDWRRMHQRAVALGVGAAFCFTASVLQERLRIQQPPVATRFTRLLSRGNVARRLLSEVDALPESSQRGKLLSLLLEATLCDRITQGLWHLRHHLGRIVRRRLQLWSPRLVPRDWNV